MFDIQLSEIHYPANLTTVFSLHNHGILYILLNHDAGSITYNI